MKKSSNLSKLALSGLIAGVATMAPSCGKEKTTEQSTDVKAFANAAAIQAKYDELSDDAKKAWDSLTPAGKVLAVAYANSIGSSNACAGMGGCSVEGDEANNGCAGMSGCAGHGKAHADLNAAVTAARAALNNQCKADNPDVGRNRGRTNWNNTWSN